MVLLTASLCLIIIRVTMMGTLAEMASVRRLRMVIMRGIRLRRLCILLRLSLRGALLSSMCMVPCSSMNVWGTTTNVTTLFVMVLKLV